MENENKFDTAELDLDAILNEFHDSDDTELPEAAPVQDEALQQQLSEVDQLLEELPQELPAVILPESAPEGLSMDTGRMNEIIAQLQEEAAEKEPAVSADATIRMEIVTEEKAEII